MTPITPDLPLVTGPVLSLLDLTGTAVFALSGALVAAGKRQTLVTFAFFALVTGVGGGTVRDLLIGAPVFWMRGSVVPFICLAMAVVVWVTPARLWSGRTLAWLDAAGLGAYAVFGAAKSLGAGIDPLPAAVMGVVTACVGGIVRDVLAGEPSILMRPELYVTAAALSAGLFVGCVAAGLAVPVAAALAALAGFGLRAAAIRWRLALPAHPGLG